MIALIAALGLDFAVLALISRASPARGARLFGAIFALALGVGVVSLMSEAVAYGVIAWSGAARETLVQSAVFAALAAGAAFGVPRAPASAPPARTLRVTILRAAAVIVVYIVVYLGAGMLAYPLVKDFYAQHHMPGIGEVLGLQVLRALLFAACCAPVLGLGLRRAPWLLGAAFSVIGGIAPLLPDNPFMPLSVRMVHLVEVGISNFVFGFILALLLTRRAGAERKRAAAPAAVGESA
jgi:hypothetical protein